MLLTKPNFPFRRKFPRKVFQGSGLLFGCFEKFAVLGAAFGLLLGNCSLIETPVGAATFVQSSPVTVNDNAAASPYPSTLLVSGVVGTVSKVTVTLSNLSHTYPADLDVLLVGPGGQSVMLMSSAGGGEDITNAVLVFDDMGEQVIGVTGSITSGTFRPGGSRFGGLPLPAPAPPGTGLPYGTTLSAVNGSNPNGTWQLFVNDNAVQDFGNVGSWQVNIAAGETSSETAYMFSR
jgi:subtilisin-like proprotein convertase family protein